MSDVKTENVGDRGLPSVNESKPKSAGKKAMVIFVVLVLAVGGAAVYWTLNRLKSAAKDSATPKAQAEQKSMVKSRKFEDEGASASASASGPGATGGLAPPPAPAEVKVPAVEGGAGNAAPIGVVGGKGGNPPGGSDFGGGRAKAGGGQVMTTIPVAKAPSPYDSGFEVNGGVQPGGAVQGAGAAGSAGGTMKPSELLATLTGPNNAAPANVNRGDGGKGALQGMLTPTNTPTVKAGFLGNRSLMVSEGTTAKCVLRTRIVAMKPGFVICKLAEPIMSANGKFVLADTGSKVTGEQSGSMRNGETRLYVLWRRIETPTGVIINIDAPATDALGGSGIDGEVDNHWSQRIGASLALSLVNDAFAYEIAKASSNNGTAATSNVGNTAFQNTTQSGNKIAEKVLDSTINIPPTLYRNQGDQILIMIPRDLDFSSVYDIQPR